jgi:hypothetical protein
MWNQGYRLLISVKSFDFGGSVLFDNDADGLFCQMKNTKFLGFSVDIRCLGLMEIFF